MPTLYVLRHAKSSWDDPGVADRDRALNDRGVRAAALMAGHLRAGEVHPALVLCSPAARTRQTLELIAPGFTEPPLVRFDDTLYGATADTLLSTIQAVAAGTEAVLLVGHNPGVEDLVVALASGGRLLDRVRAKYPTCALATLTLEEWSTLGPGGAKLVAFTTPADLA